MYGLELCPKCSKGHLYPVVTASAEAKGNLKKLRKLDAVIKPEKGPVQK